MLFSKILDKTRSILTGFILLLFCRRNTSNKTSKATPPAEYPNFYDIILDYLDSIEYSHHRYTERILKFKIHQKGNIFKSIVFLILLSEYVTTWDQIIWIFYLKIIVSPTIKSNYWYVNVILKIMELILCVLKNSPKHKNVLAILLICNAWKAFFTWAHIIKNYLQNKCVLVPIF